MKKSFKYRIFPTKSQKTILNQTLTECQWVYNKTLETRKNGWEEKKISISKFDTHKLLPIWKKEKESLNKVYSQTLQQVQERVDLAFQNFFRRVKNGEKSGYPRFKGKFRYNSFTFPQDNGCFKIEENLLKLSKIGKIRIKKHREIEGKIKRLTIQKTNTDKWFAIFSVQIDKPIPVIIPKKAIGIDLGIKTFATLSNRKIIQNPRFLKSEEKELARISRQFSKNKSKKNRKKLSRVYERINNKRRNFQHQWSRKLVDSYDIICLEKLNIKNMLKSKINNINKATLDICWNQFANMLKYKVEETGKSIMFVNPKNTSKSCSKCGSIKKDLTLKDRIYCCEKCGFKIDRDLNASINILRLGLQSLQRGALLRGARSPSA